MLDLEKEIQEIKNRNLRVETDKAWEVSWTRKIVIAFLTYITSLVWLYIISEKDFWWKAAVPAVGFILSTLTIAPIKTRWTSRK